MFNQKRQHGLDKTTRTLLCQIMRSTFDNPLLNHFALRHLKRHILRLLQMSAELSAKNHGRYLAFPSRINPYPILFSILLKRPVNPKSTPHGTRLGIRHSVEIDVHLAESSKIVRDLVQKVADVDALAPRDQCFRQIGHGVEDEVELLHGVLCPVAMVRGGPGEWTLAPAHAPHTLWESARECKSDHGSDIMSDNINLLGDVELVHQGDHVSCHGRLAEIGMVLGRTPCAAVVGRDAAIALFASRCRTWRNWYEV